MPNSDIYADLIQPWPSGDGVTVQDLKLSGDANFQSNRGINCLDPVNPQDVATRQYVLDNAGGLVDHAGTHFFGSGDAVDLAQMRPSGDVVWAGNKITGLATCTASGDGANKKYVDENAGGSGDVVGPSSSTARGIAIYDDTSGRTLADSGVTINSSGDIIGQGAILDQDGPSSSLTLKDSGVIVLQCFDGGIIDMPQ